MTKKTEQPKKNEHLMANKNELKKKKWLFIILLLI